MAEWIPDGISLDALVFLTIAILATATSFGLLALNRRRLVAPYTTWNGFLIWGAIRVYCRLWHRPRFEHYDRVREAFESDQPVIVIANHTGSVDPLILGTFLPRAISWIMLRTYNQGPVMKVTEAAGTIFVDQDGKDLDGIRQAIQVLKSNGVLGIFPEGGVARPWEHLHPFQSGIGLILRRCNAVVIPVWVSETPKVTVAFHSMYHRSRARCVFGDPIRFENVRDGSALVQRLQDTIQELSGWPMYDEANHDQC